MKSVDLAAMRQLNVQAVLRALFQHREPMTMAALVRRVSLSRRTVELILEQLVVDGWAREVATEAPASLGRPPRSYRFDPGRALFGAIAIDTHSASVALVDAFGSIRRRARGDVRDIRDPERCVRDAAQLARGAFGDASLAALGVSVTGRVDDDGTVLFLPYAPEWTGFAPAPLIGEALGCDAIVDNDANLAALGEQWLGAARGRPTFVWLVAGIRLGAGLVVQNRLHRGLNGAAGQIVNVDSMGMARLEHHPLGLLASPDRGERERAMEAVRAAEAGDPAARELVEGYLDIVEPTVTTFAWTLAPDALILGGSAEANDRVVIPALVDRLDRAGAPPIEVRASELGDDAALLGAARLARESAADELVSALREEHLVDPA